MDQRIIDLYDRFTHGGMSHRDFLDRLAALTGSTAAATALLPVLANDYARAAIVAPDDARLASERFSYDSPAGVIAGYLTRPKARAKRPTVMTSVDRDSTLFQLLTLQFERQPALFGAFDLSL